MRVAALTLTVLTLSIATVGANVPTPIAVIVNTANPIEEMTSNHLREVLLGSIREWPNRRRITIVQREGKSLVAASVLKSLLQMSPQDYNRFLLNLEFRGEEPVALKTLLSDESACNFVFNAPGAIGFVSAEFLQNAACRARVRVLRVPDRPQLSGAPKGDSR